MSFNINFGYNAKLIDRYLFERESNNKSECTIRNERNTLSKLSDFLKKDFRDATKKDLQEFIQTIDNINSRDIIGLRLNQFYKWLYNEYVAKNPDEELGKGEKSPVMKWFEYASTDMKEKAKDPDVKKFLITDEEYKQIINFSADETGMWQALWELYYISGARYREIQQMRIKDVNIDGNGVEITVIDSKS
jgi:integrase